MGTICGCIFIVLVGVSGDPGDSVDPSLEVVQNRLGPELVTQTGPGHSKSTGGARDDFASLLMAPGAVREVRVASNLRGDPFWPSPPAPPVGGRTFSWLFAGVIGATFVTFAIIAATASSSN